MATDQFVGTTKMRSDEWRDRVVKQLKPVLLDFLDDVTEAITNHISERMPPVTARDRANPTDPEPGPHFDWDPVIGLEVTMHIIMHVLTPLMKSTVDNLRESLERMPFAEEIVDDDGWMRMEFEQEIARLEADIRARLSNDGPAQASESQS
jgi:hypothetical protein